MPPSPRLLTLTESTGPYDSNHLRTVRSSVSAGGMAAGRSGLRLAGRDAVRRGTDGGRGGGRRQAGAQRPHHSAAGPRRRSWSRLGMGGGSLQRFKRGRRSGGGVCRGRRRRWRRPRRSVVPLQNKGGGGRRGPQSLRMTFRAGFEGLEEQGTGLGAGSLRHWPLGERGLPG